MKKKGLWWKILLGVVAVIIVIGLINGGPTGQLISGDIPSQASFKNSSYKHRSAMVGDYEKGDLLKFSGEVRQTIGSDSAMVSTSGENVWLVFQADQRKIAEDDEVQVLGRYLGTQSYKNGFGIELTVPLVQVDYYNVVGQ